VKVGDIVKPTQNKIILNDKANFGVILDAYEDDYGIVYYEVHWISEEPEWWQENELELVSESN
tara:strand:- start:341 stop:529 length:189 start_codon:yes stop_codon:yes gene_type:complete